MPRIVGVDIPEKENIDLALTRIYGIGSNKVIDVLKKVSINKNKRAKTTNNHRTTETVHRTTEPNFRNSNT